MRHTISDEDWTAAFDQMDVDDMQATVAVLAEFELLGVLA